MTQWNESKIESTIQNNKPIRVLFKRLDDALKILEKEMENSQEDLKKLETAITPVLQLQHPNSGMIGLQNPMEEVCGDSPFSSHILKVIEFVQERVLQIQSLRGEILYMTNRVEL